MDSRIRNGSELAFDLRYINDINKMRGRVETMPSDSIEFIYHIVNNTLSQDNYLSLPIGIEKGCAGLLFSKYIYHSLYV